jgi:oligopeptide/dipeptide ABC transporter ATP-binding protein
VTEVLEVRGARVRYRRPDRSVLGPASASRRWVEVVRGVSLRLERGKTIAIVGESGSGKTTLAMALMGLVPLHGGEVYFEGRRMTSGKLGRLRPDRARVAMMFQDPVGSLSPRMTVGSILEEPFLVHRRGVRNAREEASRLLDLVGLGDAFVGRYPHQLSGGQARRIGVARALALDPALVIADEPTAGLDVSIQGDVLNLLSDLRERLGLAVMIITHNLNVVRHVADDMAIMYLGRFVEQGPSEEIFRHPYHPYTRALLSANPNPDPDAVSDRLDLDGEVPSLLEIPAGCEFHTRCPFVQADCRTEAVTAASPRPEHVYFCHHPLEQWRHSTQ